MKHKINIATQFSRYPAGRFLTDGPNSGERFREDFLIPALLENADSTVIVLDGVRGYGSSFLEEAFGGLVRKGYGTERIRKSFELVSEDDPSLPEEINSYLDDAEVNA